MNIEDARFIVPTICGAIPGTVASTKRRERAARRFDEDDWLQVELVAERFDLLVRTELAAIQAVVDEAGDALGYGRVHVRSQLPTPLIDTGVTISTVTDAVAGRPSSIGYRESPEVIPGGFAVVTEDGCVIYGQATVKEVLCLGLEVPRGGLSAADGDALADLLRSSSLMLVHWCRRVSTTGPADVIRQFTR